MSNLTLSDSCAGRTVYENPTLGDKAVILKSSAETDGAYTLIEVEVAPGGGPPLHTHRHPETFIPVEGELGVQVGKARKMLRPGETYTIPARAVHRFYNPTDKPVRFRVKFEPGQEGFERTLMIGYGLAKDGLTTRQGFPRNLAYAAVLLHFADPHPTGILKLLMPFLRWKARQARKKGVEKELLDRYCR